jgi:hypothetical protein
LSNIGILEDEGRRRARGRVIKLPTTGFCVIFAG